MLDILDFNIFPTLDSTEWADADGDDWGDNADQYPNDPYNGEEGERESVSERSGLAQGVPGFGFMAALSALLLVAVFRSGRGSIGISSSVVRPVY